MLGAQLLGREQCSVVHSSRTPQVALSWGSRHVSAVLRWNIYTVAYLLLGEAIDDFGNLMLASGNCGRQPSSPLSNPDTEIMAIVLKKQKKAHLTSGTEKHSSTKIKLELHKQ